MYCNQNAIDQYERYGDLKHDYEVLKGILTSIIPSRVLDFGCGSGGLFPLYQDLNIREIIGQGISKESLNLARMHHNYENVKLLNVPADKLDLSDYYFNIVICNRVLQHIPSSSIEQTIKILCRLGKLIYVNKISDNDGLLLGCNYSLFLHDYVNLFKNFGFYIKDKGFVISEINTNQKWFLFERSI